MNKGEALILLLKDLERAMISAKLWQSTKPSAEALASTQPFCCDTLSFEQWLQFIFIERMQQLSQMGKPLPANFAISPMAHQCWDLSEPLVQDTTRVLMKIDELMAGNS